MLFHHYNEYSDIRDYSFIVCDGGFGGGGVCSSTRYGNGSNGSNGCGGSGGIGDYVINGDDSSIRLISVNRA